MKVLVLLSLVGLLVVVTGKSSTQFYCGRRLADTLAYLCYADSYQKRSGGNSVELGEKTAWLEGEELGLWGAGRARALGRGKRGVIAECCDKPCTLDELLTYC